MTKDNWIKSLIDKLLCRLYDHPHKRYTFRQILRNKMYCPRCGEKL